MEKILEEERKEKEKEEWCLLKSGCCQYKSTLSSAAVVAGKPEVRERREAKGTFGSEFLGTVCDHTASNLCCGMTQDIASLTQEYL